MASAGPRLTGRTGRLRARAQTPPHRPLRAYYSTYYSTYYSSYYYSYYSSYYYSYYSTTLLGVREDWWRALLRHALRAPWRQRAPAPCHA